MLRISVYLKSGAVAEFEAAAILQDAADHPRFRLEFASPEDGGRRLVYLDRDDVSAVVVEDSGRPSSGEAAREASVPLIDLSPPDTDEVLTVIGVPGSTLTPAAP